MDPRAEYSELRKRLVIEAAFLDGSFNEQLSEPQRKLFLKPFKKGMSKEDLEKLMSISRSKELAFIAKEIRLSIESCDNALKNNNTDEFSHHLSFLKALDALIVEGPEKGIAMLKELEAAEANKVKGDVEYNQFIQKVASVISPLLFIGSLLAPVLTGLVLLAGTLATDYSILTLESKNDALKSKSTKVNASTRLASEHAAAITNMVSTRNALFAPQKTHKAKPHAPTEPHTRQSNSLKK